MAGRFFHAPLLQAAGIPITAVVTSRADAVREVLPDAAVVRTDGELIWRSDVDVVIVASPSPLHAAHAASALRAGKHVVVDKPLCATVAEARELSLLASHSRRKLAVFQNRRWDSDFLTLQSLIRSHRLGDINAYHARWDRFRPQVTDRWKDSGEPATGTLYDLGSHLIDQALVLFGRPDWLQADVFIQRPNGIACDGFEILMGKGRLRITLAVSLLSADGGPRYRVHGSRGSFVKSGLDPQEDQLKAGMLPTEHSFGIEPAEQWGTLVHGDSGQREVVTAERGRWLSFYESVRRAIELDDPLPVGADAALEITEIIEAAMQSSSTGRRINLSVSSS
jgi:scyllo-inositol 2-dehydrogenase (NADP+)